MNRSNRIASLLATTAFVCSTGAAMAADHVSKPMYAVIPHHVELVPGQKALGGPIWNFSFTYNGTKYTDAFIGGDPSTATSTTVPVVLIPLDMVSGTTKEPAKKVIKSILASPIFSTTDFNFGGTDIGTTQYEDAFAKVNVWDIGGSATGYHVLLGTPTVTKQVKLDVGVHGHVGSEFGVTVVLADINWFDQQINLLIPKLKVPSDALPIFVTTQTYLTSGGGCCIGGYHSVTNAGQPYSHFTYIQKVGAFAQDVSALSHELGEWVDDPLTSNNSPCGILEVGDPLERETNYGGYPYKLNGFTYNLQDLALLPYFGAPKGTTLNQLFTLQGTKLSVCQNGA